MRIDKKRIDKGTYLALGLVLVCLLLTLVAIGAQAEEQKTTYGPPAAHTIIPVISGLPPPSESPSEPAAIDTAGKPAQSVQELIGLQLDAIRLRDADAAYALTTEKIHKKYETAKAFLNHLRFDLRAVYNHKGYKFLETSDELIQKVEMEGRDGDPVTVIYRLQPQENGGWLIESFAVLDSADEGEPI